MSNSIGAGPARKLGDELRDIRMGAGAPLEQVEADLRIKAKYVAAMEEGDIDALPARVYTEGFVRNYAVYLGLDPAEAVQRFFAEQGVESEAEKRKSPVASIRPVKVDPLSGITEKREKRSGFASAGRSLAALWPLVLIGGLGAGAYAGYGAARDAGLIPPELGGTARVAETPAVEAASVQTAPAPVQTAPAPVQTAPEQAAPEQAASMQAASMQAAPEQAAPVQVAPVQSAEAPASVAPEPASTPSETRTAALAKPVLVGAEAAGGARPDFLSYARADATPYWQAPPPEVEPVDGPVSEIEPETAGVTRRPGRWSEAAPERETTSGEDATRIAAEAREALMATLGLGTSEPESSETDTSDTSDAAEAPAGPVSPANTFSPAEPAYPAIETVGIGPVVTAEITPLVEPAAPAVPAEPPRRFALHAKADAWVKVQDATGVTIYTGILSAGESYNIPDRAGLTLRTGNAGGLVIEVEGQRFGPLGNSGAIMNGVPLNPGSIRASFTLARQATLSRQ